MRPTSDMSHSHMPLKIEQWIALSDPYSNEQFNWFIKMVVQQLIGLKDKLHLHNELLKLVTTIEWIVSFLIWIFLPILVAIRCIHTYIEASKQIVDLIELNEFHTPGKNLGQIFNKLFNIQQWTDDKYNHTNTLSTTSELIKTDLKLNNRILQDLYNISHHNMTYTKTIRKLPGNNKIVAQ